MIDTTINDDKTIAGDGEGVILVGRYHILRQLDKCAIPYLRNVNIRNSGLGWKS